jgi:hypothetical protein
VMTIVLITDCVTGLLLTVMTSTAVDSWVWIVVSNTLVLKVDGTTEEGSWLEPELGIGLGDEVEVGVGVGVEVEL